MQSIDRNTIFKFANEHYHSKPEYLWAKSPNYAVLRNIENNKWFAIIMNISGKKLGLLDPNEVEILNVKCDPLMINILLNTKGFFPAYHMNKRNWITILLDGSVSQEEIFNLLSLSHSLTQKN